MRAESSACNSHGSCAAAGLPHGGVLTGERAVRCAAGRAAEAAADGRGSGGAAERWHGVHPLPDPPRLR